MLVANVFIPLLKYARLLIGLALVLSSFTVLGQTQAFLESPAMDAFVRSGVGLIRGWACEATRIEISIDDGPRLPAGYGTQRGDTESVCGDRNNGFGLTYNWNNIGDGVHNLRAFVDDVEFANVSFTVTTLGEDYVRGLVKNYLLPNFPGSGQSTPVQWSEPHQNFVFAQSISTPTPPDVPPPTPRASLESPTQGSFESGVGLIRGWVCEATQVEISIDGASRLPTAYGTPRGDTEEVCGDRNNGFGLTFNWNNLGDGLHQVQAFADGVEFARVNFAVTTLGEDFLTGIDRKVALEDFPKAGETTTLRWSEPDQNFTLAQTSATPAKLAIVSAITEVRNAFTVAGAGVDSTDTTGVYASKNEQGQPTQLEGVAWADTQTSQAADIQLTADGLPATYTDSTGAKARFDAFTDTTTTISFVDSSDNVQAGPVTVPIDGNLILALQEMARRVFSSAQNAEVPVGGRQLAGSARVMSNPIYSSATTAEQVFTLSQLLVNVYWYGSQATGETVCAVGQAATAVGVRGLVAPTACQSPLLTALRSRFSARRGQVEVPDIGVDPIAQQSLRFDDDVVEAPCDPATDSAACLIEPTVQLKAREQEVGPPIPPVDNPEPVIPSIPSDVQASDGLFPDRVQITWGAVSSATVYQVYRADSVSSGGRLLGQSTSPLFEDTTMSPGTIHWYSVSACNAIGCSNLSGADSGFAQQQIITPNPPTGVAASDGVFPDRVQIAWNAVSDATLYQVYRSDNASSSGQLLGQSASPLFEDTTVSPGTIYWYSVRACNDAGCSSSSGADSGFALAQPVVESGLWLGSAIQFFVSTDGQQVTSTGSPLRRLEDGTTPAAIILGPVNISGCPYPALTFSVSGAISITDSRFSYSITFPSGITLLIEGGFSSPTIGSGSYLVGGEDLDDDCSPRGSGAWSAVPSGQ